MGLEIVLSEEHINALKSTKLYDRGYIIAERKDDTIVAHEIIRGTAGNRLIEPSELHKIIVFCIKEFNFKESVGMIPYINDSDYKLHIGGALEHLMAESKLKAESNVEINKLLGYCIINGDLNLYRLEKDGGVTSHSEIKIAEHKT